METHLWTDMLRDVGLGGRGQEQTSRNAPPNQGQVVTPKQELLMREKWGGQYS